MPKILVYITTKVIGLFLFGNTDYKNRAHVHVGKKDTEHLCKLWLEPEVAVASRGHLTDSQVAGVMTIAMQYQKRLCAQ